MAGGTDCRIYNNSNSTVKVIPKSYLDGAAASCGFVRKKLVREIPPKGFIDVDSRKYDLNGRNCNVQMKIHFLFAEIHTDKGPGRLEQCHDAAYTNGIRVAKVELVLLHYELKAKGKICLTYGDGGKVKEEESH